MNPFGSVGTKGKSNCLKVKCRQKKSFLNIDLAFMVFEIFRNKVKRTYVNSQAVGLITARQSPCKYTSIYTSYEFTYPVYIQYNGYIKNLWNIIKTFFERF